METMKGISLIKATTWIAVSDDTLRPSGTLSTLQVRNDIFC